MKYYVSFQEFSHKTGRPIDHPTHSDFEVDEKGFALIPNVGDHVHIIKMNGDGAAYEGKVRTRLFRYFGGETGTPRCGINIVVDTADDGTGGQLIKE